MDVEDQETVASDVQTSGAASSAPKADLIAEKDGSMSPLPVPSAEPESKTRVSYEEEASASASRIMESAGSEVKEADLGAKRDSKGLMPSLGDSISQFQQTVVGGDISRRAEKYLDATDKALSKLSQSTGLKIAPVKIPMARRRQTLAVLFQVSLYPICWALNFWAFRYWTGLFFYLYLLWIAWKLVFQTFHRDGGLPIPWLRSCFWWSWFCNYFPVTLHKTVRLDANESYIFGYHPHGIIGMGAWATFAVQTAFPRIFRGINVRLLTLRLNFYIPFGDLFLTFMGVCDASRESCNEILNQGNSLALVLGGAKEALDAHPGQMKLFLKNRKGFVKVALENGVSMVPVFGFGENELYFQVPNPKGSLVRKVQDKLQRHLGFSLPIFRGRGVFQYNFGFLPRRYPINVVFGEPIKCPRIPREDITTETLTKYHDMYKQSLKTLFDTYKHQFYKDGAVPPEVVFM